ncbi:THAP domain-containing protein 1-like isoform X2 [Diabrotica undecimpunctata]|uniref:THAP domain-containing protein 1-like isoform X2 n=1 Tax=Diabrotica undecimpunctata TaxID=50387 RepID=UPI003B63237F
MRCAVFGCSSDNQSKRNPCPDTRFFRFPKEENLIKQWVHATGRKDKLNPKTSYICSKHFTETDFYTNLKHQLLNYRPKNYRGLKKDVVPNKNLPMVMVKPEVSRIGHGGALKKRQRKQVIDELLSSECEVSGANIKQEGIEDDSQSCIQGNGFSNSAAEKR